MIPTSHTNTQRNPRDAKKVKDLLSPMLDNIIGDARKLITFPRWKPAIEMPSALARSLQGNHLNQSNSISITARYQRTNLIALFQYNESIVFNKETYSSVINSRQIGGSPEQECAHARKGNSFSQAKKCTNGQKHGSGMIGSPRSE